MWVTREVEVPAARAWDLLVDLDRWPSWGPSVAAARLDGPELGPGATGAVRAAVGPWVPFRITGFSRREDGGGRWSWRVAGVPATEHRVEAVAASRCRVGFGVPWWATPYATVCAVALRRIDHLLTS